MKSQMIRIVTTNPENQVTCIKYVDLTQALRVKRISMRQLAELQSKGISVVLI
jgi:hypothetical protein